MAPEHRESFEEKGQRFIREHNHDLNKAIRRRRIPWPKNDPPQLDRRFKSMDRRQRGD